MSFFLSEHTKIDVGFAQTPLGELTALPRPLSGFKGMGEEREGLVGGEEGKVGEWERDGKRGQLRNSALVVG